MFQFWANEEMTEPFGVLHNGGRLREMRFDGQSDYVDLTAYFGSPDSSLILQPRDSGNDVAIAIRSLLPEWAASSSYQQGAVIQAERYLWQALNDGISAQLAPEWILQKGARVQDGSLAWVCLGAAYYPESVSLSLSSYNLSSAIGGAALSLGERVLGGAAVAIYFRVHAQFADVYSLPLIGQLGFFFKRLRSGGGMISGCLKRFLGV